MKILVVNCATSCAFISLICDEITTTKVFSSSQKTSEDLLPEIDRILKNNKIKLSELDCVAICTGPGSFTGIRVGLATVKGFCCALNLPIISFNIFECFSKKGVLLTKANSGGAYKFFNNQMKFILKEEVEKIKKAVVFDCEKDFFKNIQIETEDLINGTIKICLDKFKNKQFTQLNKISVVYIQLSQAENELNKKIKNLKILNIKNENLKNLVEIEKECFEKPYSMKVLKEEITNKNKKSFGLFLDNKLIGYVSYCVLSDEIELERICVIKKYRNLNLGEQLLLKTLKKFNVKRCFLEVNKNNNFAIKLYIKLGFVEMGVRKNYYGENEDALTMQKVF